MGIVPIKMPLLVQRFFKRYTWKIPVSKNEKTLYLTFDDGPTPKITQWTLDTLKQYNAKATFFCIGSNIEKHPAIFNAILEEGHGIGNHTQNHVKGWRTSKDRYLNNVALAQSQITTHTQNTDPKLLTLFRPPYGQITVPQGKALIEQGYTIIMWSILSFDWEHTISQERCYSNVISKATSGDIIVFHDSKKASKNLQYALPKVLKYYTGLGYTFKRIPVSGQ